MWGRLLKKGAWEDGGEKEEERRPQGVGGAACGSGRLFFDLMELEGGEEGVAANSAFGVGAQHFVNSMALMVCVGNGTGWNTH